jgi:hypothetical protein
MILEQYSGLSDLLGFFAGLCVLLTFCMTRMVHLRAMAIISNVAFICYGALMHLTPIVVLHGLLLPINCVSLAGVLRRRGRSERPYT